MAVYRAIPTWPTDAGWRHCQDACLLLVRMWQETGFDDLQVVIPAELAHEVKRHRFDFPQFGIDHHGFHAIDQGRAYIRRILQVRIAPAAFGIEAGHHTAQALGPVAGAKLLAIAGET